MATRNVLVITAMLVALPTIAEPSLDDSPTINFSWPTVSVNSTKYHLIRRFVESDVYQSPVLIKETQQQSLRDGAEGQESKLTLEMWKLGTTEIEEKLWEISLNADTWKYLGPDKIVLTKFGCCDSPNIHTIYSLDSGKQIESITGSLDPNDV